MCGGRLIYSPIIASIMNYGQYDVGYAYAPPRRRLSFSPQEIRDLAIAVGGLTLAFAIVYSRVMYNHSIPIFLYSLLVSFLAVFSGFVFHEMGHKLVAQKYGCWAEFRAFPRGILMALLFSLMGFVFAAPGAVMISGRINQEQNAKISMAGPVVNLAIGFSLVPVIMLVNYTPILKAAYSVASINFLLAGFNLLPIPPLDGSKIWRWNIPVYILLIATSVAMFFALPHLF